MLTKLFQDGLAAVGFVEKEIGYIGAAGALVKSIALPPATNPHSVYADILRAIGFAEDKVQQILGVGQQVAGIGSAITVLQGADAEFAAGKEVTGSVKIYTTEYNYAFTPATPA